jgi:hypothetical protein
MLDTQAAGTSTSPVSGSCGVGRCIAPAASFVVTYLTNVGAASWAWDPGHHHLSPELHQCSCLSVPAGTVESLLRTQDNLLVNTTLTLHPVGAADHQCLLKARFIAASSQA